MTSLYCGAKDSRSGTVPISMSIGSFNSVYCASTYSYSNTQPHAAINTPWIRRMTQKHLEERSGEGNVDSSFIYSWRKMESAGQDRAGWRRVVDGLCFNGREKA